MNDIHVAILWHMHQPNYWDAVRGYYSMPWVRLHATKGYYDMLMTARKFPGLGLTFNLVPSLLEQIDDYAKGAEDYELKLSKKNPADLTFEDKKAILSRFFQANIETMIKPLHRYMELLQNRGISCSGMEIETPLKKFTDQDYLDLQVLFNLCWFGFTAREEDAGLRRLLNKGQMYTLEERDAVLEKQKTIIGKLATLYREAWEQDIIDISASPFYHPILPLVCDIAIAREGIPDVYLPKNSFRHPEDAEQQMSMSMDYFIKRFGRKPSGMWPSEGSVSPEALDIARKAGIQWSATDEDILARSVPKYDRSQDIYHPWEANGIGMFFRDRTLSDQIGFVYSHTEPSRAADDFIGRIKEIAARVTLTPACVSVILDGENPWEFFPNSGKDFLETVYSRLLSEKGIKPISFTKYLEKNPPEKKITSIFPGSWINANFDTWIGDQEEADGWDVLENTRTALVQGGGKLSKAQSDEAWREIYKAEGSDWFWWYGDDHSSPNDPEFDRLFRAHLERVYQILDSPPPSEVTEPVINHRISHAEVEPSGLMAPVIDGKITTFYEWTSSGWISTSGPEGVMSCGESILSGIFYGFDMNTLYLRLDIAKREPPIDLSSRELIVSIETGGGKYRLELSLGKPENYTIFRNIRDKWVRRSRKDTVAMDKIIEMGISFEDIAVRKGEAIDFRIAIFEKGLETERWPKLGFISFSTPDESYQSKMWQV
ncbi:MAG: glycoside hydrolase family 57 protein [Candidatus Latescibacterota bacterium]